MNIEAALSRDLEEIVVQAGGEIDNGRCACPLHNGDNPGAFAIYQDAGKQKWVCHSGSCGSGDIIDFVTVWQGLDLAGAVEWLTGEKPINKAEVQKLTEERIERAKEYEQRKREEHIRALGELRRAEAWEVYYRNLDGFGKRDLWRVRGIPDNWQDIFQLGYCDKFTVGTKGGIHHTPTLTIPIWGPGDQLVNIRHRLLNPPTPGDKYRPERAGLNAEPYICEPFRAYDMERIIVVEGEIKAMVTFITLDMPGIQVIGIPGKSIFKRIVENLKGRDVIIVMDPDAQHEARQMARALGGRVVNLGVKIDDAITAGQLDKAALQRMFRFSRSYR